MKIEWREPPVPKFGGRKHQEFLTELKRRPKKWALFQRKFRSASSSYAAIHPGFEFVIRTESDGTRTCYARYIGGNAKK